MSIYAYMLKLLMQYSSCIGLPVSLLGNRRKGRGNDRGIATRITRRDLPGARCEPDFLFEREDESPDPLLRQSFRLREPPQQKGYCFIKQYPFGGPARPCSLARRATS